MVYGYEASYTFGGERYEKVALEYGGFATGEGEGARWMVEVPAVLQMLQAAERSDATAADVRRTLLAVIAKFSERSGCCPDCDEAVESYAQALQRYEKAVEEQRRYEASITPDSHPYVVSSSGKIHVWNCQTRAGQRDIEHPGRTLQEFVHDDRGYHLIGYDADPAGSAKRMTAAELTSWLSHRKVVQRCKLCEPALPGAYASEASDVAATTAARA